MPLDPGGDRGPEGRRVHEPHEGLRVALGLLPLPERTEHERRRLHRVITDQVPPLAHHDHAQSTPRASSPSSPASTPSASVPHTVVTTITPTLLPALISRHDCLSAITPRPISAASCASRSRCAGRSRRRSRPSYAPARPARIPDGSGTHRRQRLSSSRLRTPRTPESHPERPWPTAAPTAPARRT